MKRIIGMMILSLTVIFYLVSCSDEDGPTKPIPDTVLNVIVKNAADTTEVIVNANVVVYQAESNQAVTRALTGTSGECSFKLDAGNYYVSITAQGYNASPVPNVTPVPFAVVGGTTTMQERKLNDNLMTDIGIIQGYILPEMGNFLVVAWDTEGDDSFSTVSGPDGFYIIHNLPYAHYELNALKKGYLSEFLPNTLITSSTPENIDIPVSEKAGSSITGSTSFIAGAEAKPTDIVLRDKKTLSAIPGLSVQTDLSNNYSLDSIPSGEFIIWASLKNDDNVIDPDWLFKNPGALNLTFPADSGTEHNFTLTGAIVQNSPTNPADSIYAFMADSIVPTFTWTKMSSYASVKQWIIEVRDINGNRIWGGFEPDGTVNHAFIGASETSTVFNFDDSASSVLKSGEIYQWSIWADDDTAAGVQTLLSSSEDLRGLFQVPAPAIK